MQVTRPADMSTEQAAKLGKLRKEFFTDENEAALNAKMDSRLKELEKSGETLVRRVAIEGTEIPGVVERLVKGVLGAHNREQRRRLKAEAVKLIESL